MIKIVLIAFYYDLKVQFRKYDFYFLKILSDINYIELKVICAL